MTDQGLRLKEKVGYAFGDFASSMFWKLFSMFLMFFYTDVAGLSAASVGTMLLLTRVWDSINDPLMGIISDRTNTSMGKFRPYLLWIAIPFGLIGVLTFTVPPFGATGKLVYAYITYTLMMMVYTAINVPYSSLMGVMTSNPNERTSLASFRFIGAFSGGIVVTSTASYLVQFFGNGDKVSPAGYQYTVLTYALLAAIFFFFTYSWTKERVKPQVSEKSSIWNDLKDLGTNAQWFIMLGAGVACLIFNSLRDGSILYYFKYYVKNQSVPYLGNVDWDDLSAAYLTIWLATNMIGVLLAKPLSAALGKKKSFALAMAVSGLLSLTLYWIQPEQIVTLFTLNIFIGISAGVVLPLIWSMYADIADYSEWKSGRRATGLIFSSSSMSQKMGWTMGGAITGWLLGAYGFEANAEQTDEALTGIRLMLSVYPAIGAAVSVVFIMAYKLGDKYMRQVTSELEEMRQK